MTDTAFAKVTIPSPYFVFVKVKSLATNDGELMGQKKATLILELVWAIIGRNKNRNGKLSWILTLCKFAEEVILSLKLALGGEGDVWDGWKLNRHEVVLWQFCDTSNN